MRYLALLLLAVPAAAQPFTSPDAIETMKKTCRTLAMSVASLNRMSNTAPVESDLTRAADLCVKWSNADAASSEGIAQNLYYALAKIDMPPATAADRLLVKEQAATGLDDHHLFYSLPKLAKAAFDAGDLDKADAYAKQMLAVAAQFPKDWNYGNAIHDGYMVMGRVAVARGNLTLAEQDLLLAGGTPGSPQLNSFGPNMSLAKDLLEKGRRETVLEYFALLKNFWKPSLAHLDEWAATVRGGGIPNFGANLRY